MKWRIMAAGLTAACFLGASAWAAPTTEEKLEILTQEVEKLKKEVSEEKYGKAGGKTSIGGYGELHYNNLDSKEEIDLHRVILFLGHRFSDRISFFSELELEHSQAGEGKDGGEVAMEQAYLNFDLTGKHSAVAGLLLVPAGILNEIHEPPTFYGVERNPVETNIIPTTWREAGAGLNGEPAPGWRYDLMITSGLKVPTTGANAYKVRNGRQSGRKAVAEDLAATARLKWTGRPGIELAATVQYQQDVTQGTEPLAGAATLLETHAVITRGPVTVKALYATWDLEGSGPAALGRDEQSGWYVEPAFKLTSGFGVFARYHEWDNSAGSSTATKIKQTDIGFNYWPHEDVVIKFDVQQQSGAASDDGFNLGVGYMF